MCVTLCACERDSRQRQNRCIYSQRLARDSLTHSHSHSLTFAPCMLLAPYPSIHPSIHKSTHPIAAASPLPPPPPLPSCSCSSCRHRMSQSITALAARIRWLSVRVCAPQQSILSIYLSIANALDTHNKLDPSIYLAIYTSPLATITHRVCNAVSLALDR